MIETTAKFVRRVDGGYELWPHSTDPRYQTPILVSDDPSDDTVQVAIKAKALSINSAPRSPWGPGWRAREPRCRSSGRTRARAPRTSC